MTEQTKSQEQDLQRPPEDKSNEQSKEAPIDAQSGETAPETEAKEASSEEAPVDESAPTNEEPSGEPKEDQKEDEFTWGQGLDLDITHDRMVARLTLAVDFAHYYTPESIQNYLAENRVSYGVKEKVIRKIFDDALFNQKVAVAEGRRTQHGADGYVDWQVDLSILDGAALVERGGRVDWKERSFVLEVNEGELLANLIDPTPGEHGIDVHGEEIEPKPGKEVRLPAGKNVTVTGDGKAMHAAIKGVVCREGERISISPTYVIQGDVNYATGHVKFDESVIISGGVLTDFKVNAGQDLHINGLIEGAELTAGGSIFLSAGIQGVEKAVIQAGGDITVKFVNGATLKADGDITVNGPVTQSTLEAGGSIRLVGDKGIAMGGSFKAEKEISTQVIGSESEVKTHFVVGANLSNILTKRRDEEKKMEALHENYNKLRQAVQAMDKVKQKGGKLTEQQEALRLKIIRTGLQVQGQIKKVKESITFMDSQYAEARSDIHGVIARGMAWPGAHIQIMKSTHIVKTQTSKCHFMLTPKNEIEVFAYVEEKEKKKSEKKSKSKAEKESGD